MEPGTVPMFSRKAPLRVVQCLPLLFIVMGVPVPIRILDL
jgi:hypothetical protein